MRQRIETWLRILSEPPGPACTRVHVTCTGTQVDGFVSCGPQRNTDLHAQGFTGEITALYVRRSSQGRGLGRDLLTAAANDLCSNHHTSFSLWVLRNNTQARGFYEHLGGKQIAEQADARPEGTLHELAYGWQT